MEIFKGQNLIEFTERFKNDHDCKEYLSNIKWSEQYVCRKCSIQKVKFGKILLEPAIFVAIPNQLQPIHCFISQVWFEKAFLYVLKCQRAQKVYPPLKRQFVLEFTKRTARLFMHKVREAMKSSEDFPMKGNVNVDEYVVGGYEQGKPGRSYDSTKKRLYVL